MPHGHQFGRVIFHHQHQTGYRFTYDRHWQLLLIQHVKQKIWLCGQLVSCNVSIKGIGGTNSIRECSTVKCTIEDNDDRPHDLLIPRTYYNPNSPYRLLSLQHWAQTSDKPSGTTCLTIHNGLVLASKSLSFKCTLQLDCNTKCGFVPACPDLRICSHSWPCSPRVKNQHASCNIMDS